MQNISKTSTSIKNQSMKHLVPTLLHPENRIPRKNLCIWTHELIQRLDTALISDNNTEIAAIYNLFALILSLRHDFKQAKRLCEKQIFYFVSKLKKPPLQLKYILQPYINLGRLHRLQKNWALSLSIFNILDTFVIGKNKHMTPVQRSTSLRIYEMDSQLRSVVETCATIEPIKTFLSQNNYTSLLTWSQQIIETKSKAFHAFAYEALFITYMMKCNSIKAGEILKIAYTRTSLQLLHLFKLREAELLSFSKDSSVNEIFNQLTQLILYWRDRSITMDQLVFTFHLGVLMKNYGTLDLSLIVLEQCLVFSHQLNDEIYTIDSLRHLIALTNRQSYRSELNDLLENSDYPCANNTTKHINKELSKNMDYLFTHLMIL